MDALITELQGHWDAHQHSDLMASCRTAVLSSIAGPFGLGHVAAGWDKAGGNVTTQHNADVGVFARDEENYQSEEYRGSRYRTARDQKKDAAIIENTGQIRDDYSGNFLDHSQVDCDHSYSTKSYHTTAGWRQSASERADFGADPDNLVFTDKSANRSLQSDNKHEWQERPNRQQPDKSNKEVHEHDNRRVNPAVKRGEAVAARHAPSTAEKTKYDTRRLAVTGVAEATKVGLQQSLGMLLTEFFAASFDEISDAWANGFQHGVQAAGFVEALRKRLVRITDRVAARWRDAFTALGSGFISGFLSNVVTWLINMVVTTGKRVVRVIRDGLFAILKALRIALLPPKEMTRAQGMDAATKLLAVAVVTSLGIVGEEAVEKSIASFPLLLPMASTIAAVLVGAMTGVASALLVAALDQLDIFGARGPKREEAVMEMLAARIDASDRALKALHDDYFGRIGRKMSALT